jgi:hypothetical protein
MAAGAITVRRQSPTPSMERLKSIKDAFCEKVPIAEPIRRAKSAVSPVTFNPRRFRIRPVGRAKMTPTNAKMLISHPDAAKLMLRDSINCPIMGGTLNWLRGAATLAKKTTATITFEYPDL